MSVVWLLWKDALTEARGVERLTTLGVFAVAVLLTLQFALPPDSPLRGQAAAGLLWAAVVFASVLEFRRSIDAERRDGTLDALRASPLGATEIFLGKALSSLAVIVILLVVLVPVTALFFLDSPAGIPAGIGVAALGAAGLIAWGTLLAAVAGGSRAADVVLPVLLFPLVVPQTIATVRLLAFYLAGERLADPATGFVLLGAFTAVSWGTSLLLFEYVLDE